MDHLQSMQSSTQHPNEELCWKKLTILVKLRETWISTCLNVPMT